MTWKQIWIATVYFLKTAIQGAALYIIPYFFWAFLLWVGFKLLNSWLFIFNYWQCLGIVILFRQFRYMYTIPGNKHVEKPKTEK